MVAHLLLVFVFAQEGTRSANSDKQTATYTGTSWEAPPCSNWSSRMDGCATTQREEANILCKAAQALHS